MAAGAKAKKEITDKLLEVFPGSFLYNDGKELRIPINEDGTLRQIKVALTCAKTNVEGGDGSAVTASNETPTGVSEDFMQEPTAEEKARVQALCEKLGIVE